ncbi:ABC transporter substrate-binding protein [Streptomyces mayteni]
MPDRRTVLRGAVGIAAAFAASACSAGTRSAGSGGTDTLVLGKTDGGTTFIRNYNLYGPSTQKAPDAGLVYENLARIDYSDGAAVKPWLAEDLTFDEAGTTLTITLRDDVTFSDGTPMTADDVVYSLQVPLSDPSFNIGGVTYTAVEKVDDRTVAVTFDTPAFSELNQFAGSGTFIVPAHLWADQDLNAWTNPDPIGTGPFTLERFSAQQVTLAARTDYWGGSFELKQLKIIPTNGDAVKAQLLRGDVDWAPIAWADAENEYIAEDPRNHLYQQYATGGAYSMFYNTARAPFDDVNLRRALAMTIPRTEIVATLQRPGTEAGPTGLVDEIYHDVLLPEYQGQVQEVDAAGALEELAASGYTVSDGKLVKDGETYVPTLSFNQDYGWDAYANIMIRSWQDTLGLTVEPVGAPGANLWEQQQRGDFDLTISTTGGAGPAGVYRALASQAAQPLGEKAATNFGRWNDEETDELVAQLTGSDDEETLLAATHGMQRVVAEQVPYSPIYNSYWFVAINASRWSGWPTPEQFTAVPTTALGPDIALVLRDLKRARS